MTMLSQSGIAQDLLLSYEMTGVGLHLDSIVLLLLFGVKLLAVSSKLLFLIFRNILDSFTTLSL